MSPIPDSLLIGGIERVGLLAPSSFKIEEQLNARNLCRFVLLDRDGWYRPVEGIAVEVVQAGELKFAGTIDGFQESIASGTRALRLAIDCVDHNQLADRHVVAEVYDDLTMKQIVQDIVTEHLAGEGVTVDPNCPDGPIIEHIPFNYVSCAEAFNELSKITGYFWNLDYTKVLRWIDRTTLQAPYALAPDNGVALTDSLVIERSRAQYRNEQIIIGGLSITDSVQTEELKGDGNQTTFTTALPIAKVPVIKVNRGAGLQVETVGIRQVESGKQWYWQEGSEQISQDTSGTKLTATDLWHIEYYGYVPLVTGARDVNAVAERQAVEGGTGLYQAVESDQDITKLSLGNDKALGALKRFGSLDAKVQFKTRKTGFQAGQLLAVDLPAHHLRGDFLIAAVTYREIELTEFHYDVTIVEGEAVDSWVAFFAKLMAAGRRHVIRPNEVVNLLRQSPEPVTIAEMATAVSGSAAPAKVGDLFWSGLVGAG